MICKGMSVEYQIDNVSITIEGDGSMQLDNIPIKNVPRFLEELTMVWTDAKAKLDLHTEESKDGS